MKADLQRKGRSGVYTGKRTQKTSLNVGRSEALGLNWLPEGHTAGRWPEENPESGV